MKKQIRQQWILKWEREDSLLLLDSEYQFITTQILDINILIQMIVFGHKQIQKIKKIYRLFNISIFSNKQQLISLFYNLKHFEMVRIIENYTLYQVIGEGAYGKVYRAVNKLDNKQYAVKVIQVKKFQTNKKLQQCTVHEINILSNIQKNKHIITYYDMLKTQNNFYFVYQYCNGGTLEGLLRKQQNIDEKKALLILKQLLEAFKVLNKYNIMHRDLKPDNIFFHNGVLKLGDFGFCKNLEKAQMTKTMLGSPIYMAPEILNGQIYSNKADIWSIGVVLYQMLYGYCPFQSNSIPKLIEVLKQTQLEFPPQISISSQTKSLLRRILTKDPQKRIEWMELFQIKITNEGKVENQSKFTLIQQDSSRPLKLVREINQSTDDSSTARSFGSVTASVSSNGSVGNTYSPRNIGGVNSESLNKPQNQERPKMQLLKKPQGTVEQGETIPTTSPIRKIVKPPTQTSSTMLLKEKVLKFHQQIVRGINIVRSMGLNNERSTPIFSYFILKSISDRLKGFREENLNSANSPPQQKQYKAIFDQEIDDVDYEIAMMRNKVEDFTDWKKAAKAKSMDVKNTRLFYQMVMFLSGEAPNDSISQNEMKNVIRIKIG